MPREQNLWGRDLGTVSWCRETSEGFVSFWRSWLGLGFSWLPRGLLAQPLPSLGVTGWTAALRYCHWLCHWPFTWLFISGPASLSWRRWGCAAAPEPGLAVTLSLDLGLDGESGALSLKALILR